MSDFDCTATVVITTHNRPELAKRAIASALAQTVSNVEVVVVDDGSRPAFDPRLADPRVRVIHREQADGVSAARNVGLRSATGAWITFLDDDDVLVPEMLARSIRAAERSSLPTPIAVMSGVTVLDVDGKDGETLVPPVALARGEDFFLEGKGAAGRAVNSLVAPTDVMRAIGGFDERLEAFQHDDLGLRLNAVASIVGIADALYLMTTHRAARVSSRLSAIPSDMERTMAKHTDAFARHRVAHAHFMGSTAVYHLKAGHWLPAIRWSALAVRRDPERARLWLFLAAALVGPHALRGYRRVVPAGVTVSLWTLTERRVRKYSRRIANYPRSLIAKPIARLTRAMVRRRVPLSLTTRSRGVLLLCVYRSGNARTVASLVDDARRLGWDVRLWALDRADPTLSTHTIGTGSGEKFPLLNRLVEGQDIDRFDWVVVADDDFVFEHGSIDDVLAVAEAAGLDLVQPAHSELSHRDIELGVRRTLALARRTTFVEIGPMFAIRRPWTAEALPFPAGHTMGWGLELDWFDLEARGAKLGIIDAVPIRHLQPVGKGYAKDDERERLRALLRARGIESFEDIQRTVATWRPWQSAPPW